MRHLAALALLAAAPAAAQDTPEPPTPASIVAAAPAADWRAIDPADLLVMTLAPDREGNPRQVVIQLMPAPFSQGWVGNIRTLAKAHWWDGTTVYRVVDNWVAQWGDGEDDEAKAKPLPDGVVSPVQGYAAAWTAVPFPERDSKTIRICHSSKEACEEFYATEPDDPAAALEEALAPDIYSRRTFFLMGWPLAYDEPFESVWPVHCYSHVGVARDTETTGTGAELYAVIGHAPRQLDRNIAVVGRVIEGIEHLSTLPRGKGDAGVYDNPALRVPIVSVRLGDELPAVERPRFEYLDSESKSFAHYVWVRAHRNDPFYKVPAGGIDVCNVQVPIRRVAGG